MQLLDAPFFAPSPTFFSGTSPTSSLIPDTYHVAINGRPYMLDLNQPFYRQYRRQLAQLIRTQADTSSEPGDQSMDPNSLWRRSYEDWVSGAGQRYLDRPGISNTPSSLGSLPNGFWQSKGIDALSTKWQITLLNDTTQLLSSGNSNLATVIVGTHIYVIDGQNIKYASTLGGSFTTVTGTPAVTASSIATDGHNVWVTYGASGVYTTTEGSASASAYFATGIGTSATISYVNGRLMLADGNVIYNIITNALPSPLFTAGNPSMTFTNFAEGTDAIYVGAHAGNKSWIYGMTVTSDGLVLGAPVIQGQLPDGETISSLLGYLSFLIVGTSAGVRMCTTSASGGVSLGALITGTLTNTYGPTKTVQCLAGWGRWVWFGWSSYDSVSSGLGKLDLENQVITDVLPAFCSDLMVTTVDPVSSVAIYNGSPVFAVNGLGLYGPDSANLVPSGFIDSGYVMYDLSDNKIACLLDIQEGQPAGGTFGAFSALVSTDMGPFVGVGSSSQEDPLVIHTFGVGPTSGQRFEVRVVLTRDATTTSAGPVITRWTLRSYPAPRRPLTWQLPLILDESINNRSGSSAGFDPLYELQQLETLATTAQMVTYQEGYVSYPVFVQDVEFLPSYTMENRQNGYFNGVALVTLVGLPAVV